MIDPALVVVRLIDEARRKNDGDLVRMKAWIETKRSYIADDAETPMHDRAIDDIQNMIELDLVRMPRVLTHPEIKAGMELIVNDSWNVVLSKDCFLDPADGLWTVTGTKTDGTGEITIGLDSACRYMVVEPAKGLEL